MRLQPSAPPGPDHRRLGGQTIDASGARPSVYSTGKTLPPEKHTRKTRKTAEPDRVTPPEVVDYQRIKVPVIICVKHNDTHKLAPLFCDTPSVVAGSRVL